MTLTGNSISAITLSCLLAFSCVKDSDKSLSDLKTIAKNNATNEATRFLRGFGWLVQRKVTAETAIPSAVITYMAAIRTDHKNICDAIDGVANVDALVALTESWTSDTNVKSYRRNNFA